MEITENDYVYTETLKDIYGLKEAGISAFNFIVKNITPFGYTPVKYTPDLWKHESRPTPFTLGVNNFGTKYHKQEDLEYLLNALRFNDEISTDITGRNYIGLTIDWQ